MTLLKKVIAFPFHPFLISTFSGLALYVDNIPFVQARNIFPALLFFAFACGCILVLLQLFFRNLYKAALAGSLFFLLLFSYADLHHWAEMYGGSWSLQRHTVLFPVWLTALMAGVWGINRLRFSTAFSLSQILNVSTGLTFGYQISQIGAYQYAQTIQQETGHPSGMSDVPSVTRAQELPDIVYLILDGYGRQDVLQKLYNFDNSGFVANLQQQGFYVAGQSTANYGRTALSVASALNFDYIQNLFDEEDLKKASYKEMAALIERSRVVEFLKSYNYNIVSYESGESIFDIKFNADYRSINTYSSEAISILLNKTPLFAIHENAFLKQKLLQAKASFGVDPYLEHRNRILFTLADLPKALVDDKPSFVYADILVGHPPFIFSKEGNLVRRQRDFTMVDGEDFMHLSNASRPIYIEGYTSQVSYLNSKLQETLSQLIARRQRPLVVIVQGDHGPGSQFVGDNLQRTNLEERFSILNAIFFSDQDTSAFRPTLSPVNTFRIVLNKYFGQTLPIMDNHSYFSFNDAICDFIPVTDKIMKKTQTGEIGE